MKIHEYEAKEILSRFGVPVPRGRVARTPQEARQVAQELGGAVVIKAQVHAGGRLEQSAYLLGGQHAHLEAMGAERGRRGMTSCCRRPSGRSC